MPLATKRAFLTQKGLSPTRRSTRRCGKLARARLTRRRRRRRRRCLRRRRSPPPRRVPTGAGAAGSPPAWAAAPHSARCSAAARWTAALSAPPPDKGAAAATTAPAAAEAEAAAAPPAPADASAPSPAAQRVEESLARLRQLQKPAVSTAALEAALAAPLEAHSLHTFMMIVAQQIKYPADRRYHRINTACNANFKRLAASAETRGVLAALGFVECEGGAHWKWEAAGGGSPGAAHVPQWESAKACLQARLDNFQSVGFLAR